MACFSRINRAMEAPMGPTPNWMARLFFFTSFSVVVLQRSRTLRIFAASESLTIKEFPRLGNAKPAPQNDFVRFAQPEVQKLAPVTVFLMFRTDLDSRLSRREGILEW
jgi:hypothetical protein